MRLFDFVGFVSAKLLKTWWGMILFVLLIAIAPALCLKMANLIEAYGLVVSGGVLTSLAVVLEIVARRWDDANISREIEDEAAAKKRAAVKARRTEWSDGNDYDPGDEDMYLVPSRTVPSYSRQGDLYRRQPEQIQGSLPRVKTG